MDHHAPLSVNARSMRRMTAIACLVALGLLAGKLVIWLMTGSVAILASAIDSGMDAVASLINLLAVRHALEPADAEHRFGHGKAEALAALFQALLILGSAVFLVVEAIGRFGDPAPLDNGAVAIGVMILSIVVTGALVTAQRRVAKQTGSLAIEADSVHYLADLAQNLGVIIAVALASFGGFGMADPVIALLIAGLLIFGARDIVSRAVADLMDRELSDETRAKIREIVCNHPEVHSFHELRTRRAGIKRFIQFHMEMDGTMSLAQAHVISDQVELELARAFPGAEILIHQDPVGHAEKRRRF